MASPRTLLLFCGLPQAGSGSKDDFLDCFAPVQYRLAASTGTQTYITDKALVAIRKSQKRATAKVGIVELNPEKEKDMRIKVRALECRSCVVIPVPYPPPQPPRTHANPAHTRPCTLVVD